MNDTAKEITAEQIAEWSEHKRRKVAQAVGITPTTLLEWLEARIKECEMSPIGMYGDKTSTHLFLEAIISLIQSSTAERERLRESLQMIVANTEPDAIKHRDYDHLAKDICDCARAALGENK